MNDIDFKKYFLKIFKITFPIAIILSIFDYPWDFGEIGIKIRSTVVIISVYSLIGFCCATIQNRNKLKWFSNIGIIISVVCFLIMIGYVSGLIDITERGVNPMVQIIPGIMALISLVLLIKPTPKNIKRVSTATIILIPLGILIKIIVGDDLASIFILITFSLLFILGLIITFVMKRIAPDKKTQKIEGDLSLK